MHPLSVLTVWFPDCDFAVIEHGFLSHGRDYTILAETNMGREPGRHLLQFTHVVQATCTTELRPEIWRDSWTEEFVDYGAWEAAGEPEGYVWGTNWSLAWPGLKAVEPSMAAQSWAKQLEKEMFEVQLRTDKFCLNLIFHSLRTQKIDDDVDTISQAVIIIDPQKTGSGHFRKNG
jgi:hypothetical protein